MIFVAFLGFLFIVFFNIEKHKITQKDKGTTFLKSITKIVRVLVVSK
jgi:hypothetical protein